MYKKWRIKRISLMPVIRINGLISCCIGFFVGTVWGLVMIFFSSLIGSMLSVNTTGFSLSALVFFPFLFGFVFGLLGMVFSFLFALLYNIASGVIGGYEVEIEEKKRYEYDDIYGEL